jgi:WD40 repeat protein
MHTDQTAAATRTRCVLQPNDIRIQHSQRVTALAWPPMGAWPNGRRYLASADAGGLVLVSDVTQGKVRVHLVHPDEVTALAWSPDTTTLAAACHDGSVQVWHTKDWRRGVTYRRHLFRGMPSPVRGVSYTRDGRYLASCGDDQVVRIWDACTGETMQCYYRGHHSSIHTLAWSPSGRSIASGDDQGLVRIWDAATGQTSMTYRGHSWRVTGLAWSPSGFAIVTSSWDGTVQLWDAHSGDTFVTYRGHPLAAHSACKWLGAAYSPGGGRIASVGECQATQVWDPLTGQRIATYGARSESARTVAWSPDGRSLATSDGEQGVRVW